MKKFPKNGFTLIELLVVVAILAIIMAYAVPGLTSMSERGQMRANLDKFKTSLQMARSEAVTRRASVVLCAKKNNTEVCRTGGQARKRLGNDWMMFVDRNNNQLADFGSGQCADTEDCLLSLENYGTGNLIITSADREIIFNPDGTPNKADGYNIQVCAGNAKDNNDEFRSVTISIMPTGSFSVRKGTDSCQ
ncbi:GspH/FimT family pseudopilin [Pseudoteredinibacter isoporae]|uniref:Type II secretion system protein H n=1 Tax=Pseudoteredinibacter isoporae TaxID=570281 RepID=A0A7X0MXG5_9GAMM|nr:GspH/FimT family pseudopilin [Pseudoteredinibacter isoporae]MBB6520907.1 type IV fimbrial biogenesis protein FimT [Pseudoteredinibacter isoporae]NHO86472.1 prepilin-type N-terminal cleavage/methylation domain-containing protein [Pseudoteredinibacter isoporae]NIB25076.1 prepilin-type N-terminal cleavage/methylation domain-containing protein [Pseudoteredinibacter isoporae]